MANLIQRGLLTLMLALPVAVVAAEATAVVETLHAALLQTMKDAKTLGFKGRVEKLGPVLDSTFDFRTIAKVATGRHWQSMPDTQREAFLQVFRDLSVATYAENFSGYAGEKFETLGHEQKKNAELVRTNIVTSEGKRVSLNYVLAGSNDNWKIVNVVAEGVSDLALKRSEYDGIIAAEGVDSLVAKLKAKVASYAAAGK